MTDRPAAGAPRPAADGEPAPAARATGGATGIRRPATDTAAAAVGGAPAAATGGAARAAGAPAVPAGDPPGDTPGADFALLRDKVRGMAAFTPLALGSHLLGAAIVELLYRDAAPPALRAGWGAAFVLLWTLRLLLAWRYAKWPPASERATRRWLARWRAGVLASALLWGAAAWLFYGHGGGLQRTALLLLVYSYCVASVPVLAPQLPLYLAHIALQFGPAIARVAVDPRPYAAELATVMLVILLVTAALGRNYHLSFESLTRLKLRTERLMAQLRVEKSAADAARQEAEVANRAKTQFFAAASHDLRQPLHAMGLFAEALRRRSHDDQAIELVNSINASVDALEGLFSELLDITRIDSGGVEVRPVDFALADVLRRLRLAFEPVAFDKGLELRFRGAQHHAHADALLVERILRNLVGNALRYTEDGGVLVSARRRGDRLRLQVWDTGVGIRPDEQQRVFEEFYQVGRHAAPTPDQKKGLGLGLAIVRRLAGLMGAPLALASTPGRGSVFTLDLPAADAPAPAPAGPAPAKAAPALTLDGRRIVVVEDDAAVRHGLEVLLRSWGAEVECFDTAAAACAWAVRRDPPPRPPDLLIVDYRLEDGATGVDAIDALRAGLARHVPAIVVTGSTMTAHDAEAERHDFHVMVKPVVPNRLRAMIGFKLGVR